MTRIGLMSDTHGTIPIQVFNHFEKVDEIWHAGDIGNLDVLNRLSDFKPLRSVFGNIDGHEIRQHCSEDLFFTIEQTRIYMTHIGGYPPKYNARTKPLIASFKPHVFIAGHSHILKVMPDPILNVLHINPGACGKQGWQKVNTIVLFDVTEDRLQNLQIIEFPKS